MAKWLQNVDLVGQSVCLQPEATSYYHYKSLSGAFLYSLAMRMGCFDASNFSGHPSIQSSPGDE